MNVMRTYPDTYDDNRDPHFVSTSLNATSVPTSSSRELSPEWRAALATFDAHACHRLAAEASAKKDATMVPALCALVETSSQGRWLLWGRQKAWRWARVMGINALARIGAKQAIPTIARALFDLDPHIRETAAYELPTFGADVVPALRQCLRDAPNWTLSGMEALIHILEKMGDTSATSELAHVIAEQLPGDPTRWARQTFVRPFTLVGMIFCVVWGTALFVVTPDPSIPFWESGLETGISLAVSGFVPLVFLYMMLVCIVFLPLLNLCAARERGRLAQRAIEAVSHLQDKRPLPLLMDIAFGPRQGLAFAAQRALIRLLPLLDASDTEQLSPRSRHQIAQALGTTEPALDMALLNALEHVGFGQDAKIVEEFAQEGATEAVRERAARLLPILQERQRAETASASLLRPSATPAPSAAELLRASGQMAVLPAEQLLRPSAGNGMGNP